MGTGSTSFLGLGFRPSPLDLFYYFYYFAAAAGELWQTYV